MRKYITETCNRVYRYVDFLYFFKKGSNKIIYLLLILLTGNFITAIAVEKEILESLVNENRFLSAPIELHLTSADAPFSNSTVSLNHEDAWLFFDNIKPSVVIDSFSSNIYINGTLLNNGVNGRVAVYSHGTVVLPHSSAYKPLTVYTEENFNGDSLKPIIHTFYNSLGTLNNAIKSFRLKRGYMATFANSEDGSGYSRVFIADLQDLEFEVMPDELYGTVSFIRVLKHQWVSKKGWCGWDWDEYQMVNATCYYDWSAGGNTSANLEYTPIHQKIDWPSWSQINEKQNVSHLLGFNEPDRPDQADMSFEEIFDVWPGMYQSGLRVGTPAWANHWGGNGGNLFDFIEKCDELNYRVDFVALHCYWGGKSPTSWYNDLKYIHERTGRPLWITEWNNGANWTGEWWPDDTKDLTPDNAQKQLEDLTGILQVLDTAHFIERYFIYNWVEDRRAMILNGELTPAGEYYAANKPQIAYKSIYEFIPEWNFYYPELTYRYLSLSNSIRLSWTNNNGELCKGYKIEKKINNGDFETILTSDDRSVLYYLDPIDSEIKGSITYRLSLLNHHKEYVHSNVVTYYQTHAIDTIQFGNFMVDNLDWNTTLFTKEYKKEPLVILGIPTFNNTFPMTQRANNVTNTLFKFQLEPWTYLNISKLTKKDSISIMILPSGTYNFDSIKAEANVVNELSDDWINITFEEAFNLSPVIFCNILSNNNSFPLTVAVRNITTNGFEVCLKSEEAISRLVYPETIHFFSIEPGKGKIGDKRFTVGKSEEGSGIASKLYEIEFDSTYSEPILFAGLLSAADNFASTLRYSFSGSNQIEILKQREMSGSLTTSKEDQFGWMIIDMAEDQNYNTVSKVTENNLHFYPNPVTDVIYFNFSQPTHIEIFDITGNKLLEKTVSNSINISLLPVGIYTIKAQGSMPVKFIKR